ncbi:MAG: FAD-dependent monooxygenase [Rhizobiaceae bacterium]|nr:FAD-dependent monooxygenase [Rhizobiaceae bacterium]
MGRAKEIGIVGAGPAGLAAALFLHRAGHKVTIYERFEEPKPLGSGLILQPTGLTVLDALGLRGQIEALGARIDRLHGTDSASGRTVLDVRYDVSPRGRYGVAVHRGALFDVLYGAVRAEKIDVVTDNEISGINYREEYPALFGSNQPAIKFADLVVDASGGRSKLIGQYAREPAEPKPLAYGAFWASLKWRAEGFDPNALMQRYRGASVMIGVLPIGSMASGGEPMAAFFWSLKPDEADAVRAGGLDVWKDKVAGYWPEARVYLEQIGSFDDLTLARYGHHTLKHPTGRDLAFIGDAAHSTSPQLGQGANMALLDAAALAHAIETSPDIASALEAYCRMRRRHVHLFQWLSYALTPFYQSNSRLLPMLRDTLVATVAKVPPMPALLAAMVSGTLFDPFTLAGLKEPDWRVPTK